jgi:hypothetical protein
MSAHSPVTKSLDLDRVADGEDIGIARAHLVVDADAPSLADGQARHFCQRRIRTNAKSEDHDVGRMGLSRFGFDVDGAVRGRLERRDAVIKPEPDSMPLHMAFDDAGHFPVERRQNLIEHFDDRDVEAAMNEIFRGLEADEPAADNDRPGLRPHCLKARVPVHAREEQRALIDPLADRPRIGHGSHLENAGEVDARQRRTHRRRSGGQHKLIVTLGRHLAGQDVTQIDGHLLRRDGDRLATRSRVYSELVAEGVDVRHQQARLLLDDAPDVVWQPAVRVRDIRSPLDHENLGLFVQSTQACRA